MATANNTIRVTELDFENIKNNLKNFLRNQDKFQDFDFEGSGMSVLLDILAYNTHYMGYYLNMVGNEMFLDTAQLRQSIISHAKNLNYIPKSSVGAHAKVNIRITPTPSEDQNKSIVTIQKYNKFIAQDMDGINYQFVAINSNTAPKVNGSFYFANTALKQGEVVTRQFVMDASNPTAKFNIPSSNVDTSTITVLVQESSTNTNIVQYSFVDDITTIASNSTVYFVEENPDLTYTVYFGDDVLGQKPRNGNIITVSYLDVSGSVANNISKIYPVDSLDTFSNNVEVSVVGTTYGGAEKETIDQIRFRAPYYYTTQNRAVTVQDYATLILKDYTNIDSVTVWGGEDNDPVVYGKVFMSLKTKNNYALTNLEKEDIKQNLIKQRNVLTITPEIIDPDYQYILVKGNVYYNKNLTDLNSGEILSFVRAAIQDYNNKELNTFESTFRKSKLQSYIENSEKSITGSDLTIYIQKRIPLELGSSIQYTANYYTSLQKGDYNNRIFTTPEVQIFDNIGISRDIFFEENTSSNTGIDSIILTSSGLNYSVAPTVTIVGDGTGAIAEAVTNGNQLVAINVKNPGINYTRANILITGQYGSGAVAVPVLQNKVGTLRSYYLASNGEKIIVNENAGKVNYEQGTVTLTPFLSQTGTPQNRYYDTDVFTFNAPSEKDIINPVRNKIMSIDLNDPIAVQINVIAE